MGTHGLFLGVVGALILFFAIVPAAQAQAKRNPRIDVRIVTDEADAVLRLLEKREKGQEITDTDWQQIFGSEGYVRLKKRELAMSRPFTEPDFKTFAMDPSLLARRAALADTLAQWKKLEVVRPARLALAYLPVNAHIRAKIYPVIKPRSNSFVFDLPDDPAIFLFLDPAVTREKFENTLAHELHHIGFGTGCPPPAVTTKIERLPANRQKLLKWIGAFGEGFAMLAAAGGPDIHPHQVSLPADRERWDHDLANFNTDLRIVERFFLDLDAGKLSEQAETETARSFYGVQGPWYTVGWQMAVVIEKTFGRKRLIAVICDQRKLLSTYNQAVKKYNRRNHTQLALWSPELIKKLN
jgi:hypothetical protein